MTVFQVDEKLLAL